MFLLGAGRLLSSTFLALLSRFWLHLSWLSSGRFFFLATVWLAPFRSSNASNAVNYSIRKSWHASNAVSHTICRPWDASNAINYSIHLLVLEGFKRCKLQRLLVMELLKCCKLQHLLVLDGFKRCKLKCLQSWSISYAVMTVSAGLGTFQTL